MKTNTILNGDVEHLKEIPDESINCVMTSPPYWALRDYGGTVEVIWDAWDKKTGKCWNQGEHDFSLSVPPRRQRSVNDVKNPGSKQATVKGSNIDLKETQFCSKCQAWKGQLGLEPTFNLYIKHLCDIFDEVKRVLRKDGTCWINLGDTYGGGIGHSDFQNVERYTGGGDWKREPFESNVKKPMQKSLIMIPFRFAIEMVNRGWILRNTIVWHKPNCMPSSVKDRFTVDFEYIFFFVKNNKPLYWINERIGKIVNNQPLGIYGKEGEDWEWRDCLDCKGRGYISKPRTKITILNWNEKIEIIRKLCKDCKGSGKKKYNFWDGRDYWFETQYDSMDTKEVEYRKKLRSGKVYDVKDPYKKNLPYHNVTKEDRDRIRNRGIKEGFRYEKAYNNPQGKNKRTIWKIATQPFPEAHFAVYPEAICEIPIKSGCPEFVCNKCGKARERIFDYKSNWEFRKKKGATGGSMIEGNKQQIGSGWSHDLSTNAEYKGLTNCNCNAGFHGGIVLDPFFGSGTTGVVALKQNKQFIGIELNPEYVKIAEKRLKPYLEQQKL